MLVAGDIAAAFNNDANTLEVAQLHRQQGERNRAGQGTAAFSPHKTADVSLLPEQDTAEDRHRRAVQGHGARFDGSDSMPAKVGAGTFWTEPVKWLSGQQDLDTTLNNIDASFPKASS